MLNRIIDSINSTIDFIIDIKHLTISQWDLELKIDAMPEEDIRQRR